MTPLSTIMMHCRQVHYAPFDAFGGQIGRLFKPWQCAMDSSQRLKLTRIGSMQHFPSKFLKEP